MKIQLCPMPGDYLIMPADDYLILFACEVCFSRPGNVHHWPSDLENIKSRFELEAL